MEEEEEEKEEEEDYRGVLHPTHASLDHG